MKQFVMNPINQTSRNGMSRENTMKQTRSHRYVAGTIGTLGLLGAMLVSAPARGELLTDYVNATNAAAVSSFAGSLAVGSNLLIIKPRATGGAVTYANGREIHTFLSAGTLTVTAACTADCLVVAGGGGGGRTGSSGGASGGGGGGLVYTSLTITAQSPPYTVSIGAGGAGRAGSNGNGSTGGNSVFSAITAYGGGAGVQNAVGGNGGSGGGGANGNGGGTATAGQGHNGGNSVASAGAGGGGAGAVGSNASSGVGGNGGAGFACSISETNTYYAGGGAGAATTCGTGGIGGGGDASSTLVGMDGISGLGGGGGAGSNSRNGGSGGSGIVIISLPADSNNIDVASAVTSIQSTLVGTSNALNAAITAETVARAATDATNAASAASAQTTATNALAVANSKLSPTDARYVATITNVVVNNVTGAVSGAVANLAISTLPPAYVVTNYNDSPVTFNTDLVVRGSQFISNTLAVVGSTTIKGTLWQTGPAWFTNNVRIGTNNSGTRLIFPSYSFPDGLWVGNGNVPYNSIYAPVGTDELKLQSGGVIVDLAGQSSSIIMYGNVTQQNDVQTYGTMSVSGISTLSGGAAVTGSLTLNGNPVLTNAVVFDAVGAAAAVQANLNNASNALNAATATVQANVNSVSNSFFNALLDFGPYGDVSMGTFQNRAP